MHVHIIIMKLPLWTMWPRHGIRKEKNDVPLSALLCDITY
jgi:hypothetical protein